MKLLKLLKLLDVRSRWERMHSQRNDSPAVVRAFRGDPGDEMGPDGLVEDLELDDGLSRASLVSVTLEGEQWEVGAERHAQPAFTLIPSDDEGRDRDVDDEEERRIMAEWLNPLEPIPPLSPEELAYCAESHGSMQEEAARLGEKNRIKIVFDGRALSLSLFLQLYGDVHEVIAEADEEGWPAYMVYEGISDGEGEILIEESTPEEIELRLAIMAQQQGSRQVVEGLELYDEGSGALAESGHRLHGDPEHIRLARAKIGNMTPAELAPLPRLLRAEGF